MNVEFLVFFCCGTPTARLEKKPGLPTPTPGPKPDSGYNLVCDILIVYFMDDLREILNSANKRCAIVYKQTKWHDDRTRMR